jgi:hypothetical protein
VDGAIECLQVFVFKENFGDSKSGILFPLFIPFSFVRDLSQRPEEAERNCFPVAYGDPYPPFASLSAPRASRGLNKEFAPLTTFHLGLRPKPQ